MVPIDQSDNIGIIKHVLFTTQSRPPPIAFKLRAKKALDQQLLINSLSLVTGKTSDYFSIIIVPNTSTITTDEQVVVDAIAAASLEYEILILNIEGSTLSPIQLLQMIDDEKLKLFSEVPDLDSTQDIGVTGKEELYSEQQQTYDPKPTFISTFDVKFDISIRYTGTAYGVILNKNDPAPSVQQIKNGLNAINIQTHAMHAANVILTVDQK